MGGASASKSSKPSVGPIERRVNLKDLRLNLPHADFMTYGQTHLLFILANRESRCGRHTSRCTLTLSFSSRWQRSAMWQKDWLWICVPLISSLVNEAGSCSKLKCLRSSEYLRRSCSRQPYEEYIARNREKWSEVIGSSLVGSWKGTSLLSE